MVLVRYSLGSVNCETLSYNCDSYHICVSSGVILPHTYSQACWETGAVRVASLCGSKLGGCSNERHMFLPVASSALISEPSDHVCCDLV